MVPPCCPCWSFQDPAFSLFGGVRKATRAAQPYHVLTGDSNRRERPAATPAPRIGALPTFEARVRFQRRTGCTLEWSAAAEPSVCASVARLPGVDGKEASCSGSSKSLLPPTRVYNLLRIRGSISLGSGPRQRPPASPTQLRVQLSDDEPRCSCLRRNMRDMAFVLRVSANRPGHLRQREIAGHPGSRDCRETGVRRRIGLSPHQRGCRTA
jgi:hypothetical protein